MRLNIHTIIAQNFKRPNRLFLCWLVAYNHTFTFMYFFPEIVVVPQSLEQLKKETITNQADVCWHPRNLCFDFLNNARELLLRQALRALKESLSAVCGAYVNKGGEANVYILFLNLLILCEFIKVSGKKYIIRKVWLYTIYTIYQLCNGWVEVLSYYSVYIQTHNGTLMQKTYTGKYSINIAPDVRVSLNINKFLINGEGM